jgi:hypothetical protein
MKTCFGLRDQSQGETWHDCGSKFLYLLEVRYQQYTGSEMKYHYHTLKHIFL